MRVDSNISSAIDRYLKDSNLTAKDLAATMGVSEPAMVKWRRPGNGISQRYWEVLFPKLKKYLPKDRIYIDERGVEHYSSMLEGTGGSSYFVPKYMPQMVPVLTFGELESFNHIINTIEQYSIIINAHKIEYRPRKKDCGSGVFASYVNFCNDIIPAGALLFASTELRPKDQSIILFLSADGEMDLGRFELKNDRYVIQKARGGQTDGYINNIADQIKWMYPVMYYEVVTF